MGAPPSNTGGAGKVLKDADAPILDSGNGTPVQKCGNGILEAGEECDDGNRVEGDGCSGACTDTRACDACVAAALANPDLEGLYTPSLHPACEGLSGYAPGGPAAGEPRIDLCRAVYDCVLRTRCGRDPRVPGLDPTRCYCGTAVSVECTAPGHADGPCKEEIEEGLETGDPDTISQGLSNTAFPGGVAMAALHEDNDVSCQEVCFPLLDGGSSGGASGSGGVGTSSTGGGGTPSTGGTTVVGGTSSAGGASNTGGGISAGGSSGAGGGASSHAAEDVLQANRGPDCLTCAQTNCPGGPDATNGSGLLEVDSLNDADRKLATDMLGCIFPASGASCAVSSVDDCYCGTSGNDCTKPGKANGVCESAIETALGSTDVNFVVQHLRDPALPGGLATILAKCVFFGFDTLEDPTCDACLQAP